MFLTKTVLYVMALYDSRRKLRKDSRLFEACHDDFEAMLFECTAYGDASSSKSSLRHTEQSRVRSFAFQDESKTRSGIWTVRSEDAKFEQFVTGNVLLHARYPSCFDILTFINTATLGKDRVIVYAADI